MSADSTITIPVSRSRALFRAVIWGVPAVLSGLVAFSIYGRLHFVPSGISNRFIDYAIAIVALPIPLLGLWTGLKSLGWLMLFAWGSAVEIVATKTTLQFHLGPFAKRTFLIADLDIRYPFQWIDDEDESAFESFLPEEQQRVTLLPRIVHPTTRTPLQRTILQFAVGDEFQVARALRPMIEQWQAARPQ